MLIANCWTRIPAETQNTQGRRQALQKDCYREGKAPPFPLAPYADVEGQEAQRQAASSCPGERRGHPEDQENDSVLDCLSGTGALARLFAAANRLTSGPGV